MYLSRIDPLYYFYQFSHFGGPVLLKKIRNPSTGKWSYERAQTLIQGHAASYKMLAQNIKTYNVLWLQVIFDVRDLNVHCSLKVQDTPPKLYELGSVLSLAYMSSQ